MGAKDGLGGISRTDDLDPMDERDWTGCRLLAAPTFRAMFIENCHSLINCDIRERLCEVTICKSLNLQIVLGS